MEQQLSIEELKECYKRKVAAFNYLIILWQIKHLTQSTTQIGDKINRFKGALQKAMNKHEQYEYGRLKQCKRIKCLRLKLDG